MGERTRSMCNRRNSADRGLVKPVFEIQPMVCHATRFEFHAIAKMIRGSSR